MDIYDRLIENPLFFKWIFCPSEELNSYWGSYLEQNPQEMDLILEFKVQFEKYLKFDSRKISESDKQKLALRIRNKLKTIDKKKKRRLIVRNLLKYAAVAVLFFLIGSSLVYLYMDSRQPEIIVDNTSSPAHAQEPMLIIDEHKKIQLNHGESKLDYSDKNEIIVNESQTLTKKDKGNIPEINTLVIPYGNRSIITLADGSKVWLNAGSRLIYPSEFVDKKREVFLVGEAYFVVTKNENKPFVVKTTDIEISVLGTHFNVSAYPEDYSVQTVLAEGSVRINKLNSGLFEKGITLTPGQLAYYNKKNEKTRIYNVDVEQYTSWTEGLFSFSNTDFNRIVKKLERYYNIRFQFDDPLKGTIQISGKLDVMKDKKEVFEYLSILTGLDFIKMSDNNYLIK
jgi:hypothetical protein